ncbi:hypothetical protein SORBI_3001G110250 [Sorghum bicolor]|uniref:Uncharacterized protein n=1 Tax=Sorghum bicolor TaxID=4558 RepID=A0A1Z5S586_SORBI|nr:hypothetical protein SORBI_3001G110250 [Sorghum bicolor]
MVYLRSPLFIVLDFQKAPGKRMKRQEISGFALWSSASTLHHRHNGREGTLTTSRPPRQRR